MISRSKRLYLGKYSIYLQQNVERMISWLFLAGVVEPVEVVDNGDQTHTVSYVPTREGPYSINVLYADEEIPRR